MKDLRFYDFGLNLLHIEHKIISSNWTTYFNDLGKAEIHLSTNSKAVPLLFENKYLIITEGENQAIVTAKQIGSKCVIYAKTPNWILSKKLLAPFESVTENAETKVREFVASCFSDCDEFVLGDILGTEETQTFCEESYTPLFDVIKGGLLPSALGHRVYFDIPEKKWVFEVIKGTKRDIEISHSMRTAYDMEYVFDMQNYYSFAKYKTRTESGEYAWESTQKDDKSGLYKWETVLFEDASTDAQRELAKCREKEEITAKVRSLEYGKDYSLGDTLNIKFECGDLKIAKKVKIIGINMWCEAEKEGYEPIFEMVIK
ncbi:MAG: hypothetical protein IKB60_03720 [Clostridia bacterium]|nr:hypothetical protein [Clostridia bacterium]